MSHKPKLDVTDIVREGREIWRKCTAWHKTNGKEKDSLLRLHKKITSEHADFASIYAIVVRSIVYEGVYYESAMNKYVQHLMNHPWKERDEYLDRQADYLVYLQRERNPRVGSKEVAQYRDHVRKQLHEEDKEFMECADEMKKEIDKEMDCNNSDRRQRLYELMKTIDN